MVEEDIIVKLVETKLDGKETILEAAEKYREVSAKYTETQIKLYDLNTEREELNRTLVILESELAKARGHLLKVAEGE